MDWSQRDLLSMTANSGLSIKIHKMWGLRAQCSFWGLCRRNSTLQDSGEHERDAPGAKDAQAEKEKETASTLALQQLIAQVLVDPSTSIPLDSNSLHKKVIGHACNGHLTICCSLNASSHWRSLSGAQDTLRPPSWCLRVFAAPEITRCGFPAAFTGAACPAIWGGTEERLCQLHRTHSEGAGQRGGTSHRGWGFQVHGQSQGHDPGCQQAAAPQVQDQTGAAFEIMFTGRLCWLVWPLTVAIQMLLWLVSGTPTALNTTLMQDCLISGGVNLTHLQSSLLTYNFTQCTVEWEGYWTLPLPWCASCSIAGFNSAAPAPPERKAVVLNGEEKGQAMGLPPGPPRPMGMGAPGMMPFGRPPMMGGMAPNFPGPAGCRLSDLALLCSCENLQQCQLDGCNLAAVSKCIMSHQEISTIAIDTVMSPCWSMLQPSSKPLEHSWQTFMHDLASRGTYLLW